MGLIVHIRKLLLPRLSDNIINEVYNSIDQNSNLWDRETVPLKLNMYNWMPANDVVQDWCKFNISPDLYWGIQVIDANLPMHKDHGTEIKFNYIIDQGGSNPITNYFDDEGKLIDSYTLMPHTWYILNVAVNHSVLNIEPGKKRISITSRIMP